MKKRLLSLLLSVNMAILLPNTVFGEEFTDGSINNSIIAEETDVFSDGVTVEEELQKTTLFSDSTVEESAVDTETYGAQDVYNLSVSGTLVYSEVQEFIDLVNAERAKLGLEPHMLDKEMMELAAERAVESAIYYSHDRPDGSREDAGECLAMKNGVADANDAINLWKSSQTHWGILMSEEPGRIGFIPFTYKYSFGTYKTNYVVNLWNTQGFIPADIVTEDKVISESVNIRKEYLNYVGIDINNEPVFDTENQPVPIYTLPGKKIRATSFSYTGSGIDANFVALNSDCGTWISSNPEVAVIDANGTIETISPGKTNIYFYLNGEKNIKSEYGVIIVRDVVQKLEKPILKGTSNNYQYATLTWKKVANAKGYEIYGYNSGKKTFGKIATVDGNTLKYEKKIGYGRDGRFKIRAYNTNSNGNKVYGPYSNIVTVQTAAQTPKISSVKASGSKALTVAWNKVSAANGYQIYRYIKKDGNYNLVKTVNSKTTSFKNTGLVKGRTYYYKIKAYRILDNGKKIYSAFSAPVATKAK